MSTASDATFGPVVALPVSALQPDAMDAAFGPLLAVPTAAPLVHRVHYDITTGEIVALEMTNAPSQRDGLGHIDIEQIHGIHPSTHKVHHDRGTLIEKTDAECATALMPAAFDVHAAIYQELKVSDVTQVPDYPMDKAQRAAWASYRQALRDLSKHHTDHLAMIRHWPRRPDGTDPIAGLRGRIPG